MQERVEVPELPRMTLVGDSVHVRPEDGLIVVDRLTVPVNPFRGVMVIVDGPLLLASSVMLVGLADMLKLLTVKATVTE